MKKIIILVTLVLMTISAIGCGKEDNSETANTIGAKYANIFNASKGTTCDALAEELLDGDELNMNLVKVEVEPGFLNGFDDEITGFNEGVMLSPMIGSIPFVGYVFETSDPNALETLLKDKANLRWNICTEADEMVSSTKGNFVFFMMCTNENQ